MALTKRKLTSNLSKKTGFNEAEVGELIGVFFREIISLLTQGTQIHLSGFGKFTLRDKKERPGRNLKTGKYAVITPRRVVTFLAGKKLKDRIEMSTEQICANKKKRKKLKKRSGEQK